MSKEDQLAKELMLPRMNKNAVKIMIDSNDDAEDIQNKKKEAEKLLGIRGDDHFPQQMPQQQNAQQFKNPYGNQQPLQFNQPPQLYNQQPQQFNPYSGSGMQQQPPYHFNHQPPQFNQNPPPLQFQQQPTSHQNYQLGQAPQLLGQQSVQPKKIQDDSKLVRKFSMDTGAPTGLNGQRRTENNDAKATINANPYGMGGGRTVELNDNNKTVQLRPNSQHQQFQGSQQYGLPSNSNLYAQRQQEKM